MKKIIINADDFGHNANKNEAIKLGFQSGIITSTSVITNMEGFEHAVNEVLPEIPFLDLGFHFNIIEGKSLTNPSLLTDKNGYFNCSYPELILKSPLKKFQEQLETEFRAQIEKILPYKKLSHVDSHVHTHAIPPIFNLVQKLAKEYEIPYIRTQHEIPYKIKSEGITPAYCVNTIKNILLNTFTAINKKSIKDISTTDYFIGVLYTGCMTTETILEGLNKIQDDNSLTEIIFHPTIDIQPNSKKRNREFEITQDNSFRERLDQLEYLLTSFNNLG